MFYKYAMLYKYAMPSALINTFFEWIDNDLEEGAYLQKNA
jgi:hypothetical protein